MYYPLGNTTGYPVTTDYFVTTDSPNISDCIDYTNTDWANYVVSSNVQFDWNELTDVSDYQNMDWGIVDWADFQDYSYVSNWSYVEWTDFDDNDYLSMDWASIDWTDFSDMDTVDTIDWNAIDWSNQFTVQSDYQNMDWGIIDWADFQDYSDISDWGYVDWADFDSSDYEALAYDEIDWSDFSNADWGKFNWNEVSPDTVAWADVLYEDNLSGKKSADKIDCDTDKDYGADEVNAGQGNDQVYAGQGLDSVFGGTGKDSLYGEEGSDYLDGGTDADKIDGGTGSDELLGGAGNDTMTGGTGNDILLGGDGKDSLTGGAGQDTFEFNSKTSKDSIDTITDFSVKDDTIQFGKSIFSKIGKTGDFKAHDARFYSAAGAQKGHDADDRIIYDSKSGALYYDADGNGKGVAQEIALIGKNLKLTASDFSII